MEKSSWVLGVCGECEDCGKTFEEQRNGQALAAKHAKHYKHKVTVEVTICSEYDGREG